MEQYLRPSSVLFCCDHNSIRSPIAEGLLKRYIGTQIFVQSAGVVNERDIDGFAIAVCQELNVELTKHTVRSFQDLEDWGDNLDSYDLIIALSRNAQKSALAFTYNTAVDVEFWEIADPTIRGETRDEKLAEYRAVRDDILTRIKARF